MKALYSVGRVIRVCSQSNINIVPVLANHPSLLCVSSYMTRLFSFIFEQSSFVSCLSTHQLHSGGNLKEC